MSDVQQVLVSSNQAQDNTKDARVVMVDKVIHVSEVTCEKVDALGIPNEENKDHLQNPTLEMDQ